MKMSPLSGKYISLLFCITGLMPGAFAQGTPAGPPCRLRFITDMPAEPCNDYRLHAPLVPEHTPVKVIRLVVHVVQQDAGSPPRNFEDNATGRNWINAMLWHLNVIFRNLVPPGHTDENCPAAYMKQARIQFRTDSIFFHQSSRHWNQNPRGGRGGDTWCDIWDNLVAANPAIPEELRENAFHVFLVHSTWSEMHTGYSPGIGALHANFVVLGGYYLTLFETENPEYDHIPHGAALSLAHEFGHAFGLFHTDGGDFCCDTPGGNTNNLMHGKDAALTQCQLARMHYLLESGENKTASGLGSGAWKTIVTDYCQKDANNPIVIGPGQSTVWAAEKKLNADVIVQAGGQLVIRCRIGLPDDAQITVERGARLIVDGGTITHNSALWPRCPGGAWKGIFVDGTVSVLQAEDVLDEASMPGPGAPGAVWLRDARMEHAGKGLVQGTGGVE